MVALILTSKIVSAQRNSSTSVKSDTTAHPVFTLGEVVVTGEQLKPASTI
jgi:hypothetical protein